MEEHAQVRISDKGRLAIPASIRERLGMGPGDVVDLRGEDNELRISTLQGRIERAQDRLKAYAVPGRLMSEESIEERREEARREEMADDRVKAHG